MKILFIHQNFPGQFKYLAPRLATLGHTCVALTLRVEKPVTWKGLRILPYRMPQRKGQVVHPWLLDLDTQTTRAEGCYYAALKLREAGFKPDLILAHHGWGESMFLRDVWPDARLGLYCEFYHHSEYPYLDFDPEFQKSASTSPLRIRMKNLNNHIHFSQASAGISPTCFQADTFPEGFRDKITICHDGIDTTQVRPDPAVQLQLEDGTEMTRSDEIVTFVNRNLEPYRGYHRFMRALPQILKERPKAQIVIVGGNEVSYGAKPPKGQTWKQIFIDEVRGRISTPNWQRVHFLGRVPYEQFLRLLQVSRVHVYLTYPFVLSWSLLEAMACEASIVANDVAPVREVITHDKTGRLVDFFDTEALVTEICTLLESPEDRIRLGRKARQLMVDRYDLRSICLPLQEQWVISAVDEPLP